MNTDKFITSSVDNAGNPTNLTDVIETVLDEAVQKYVSVGDIIDAVGRISFTPLLLLPAIALATPLSGIPLFSAIMGVLIFLVALQMILQRDHLWLPERITNLRTKSARIRNAFEKIEPATLWLDERTHPRLTFFARRPFVLIPQILCLLSGLMLPMLEFVPFTSSLIGLSVALLALGMLARDGVLLLIACAPYVAIGWLTLQVVPNLS